MDSKHRGAASTRDHAGYGTAEEAEDNRYSRTGYTGVQLNRKHICTLTSLLILLLLLLYTSNQVQIVVVFVVVYYGGRKRFCVVLLIIIIFHTVHCILPCFISLCALLNSGLHDKPLNVVLTDKK